MKLEQLYKPFIKMSLLEQIKEFERYFEERTKDLAEIISKKSLKKKSKEKTKRIKKEDVTPHELELLKKLGMNIGTVNKMRNL